MAGDPLTLAPTPLLKPFAPLQPLPQPYFGLTQTQQLQIAAVPQLAQTPTLTGTPGIAAANAQQSATQTQFLLGVTGGAVDSNPAGWTPDEAAAQTDRALARIGQVNPQLAQQLQAQRTGQQVPDSGGGFLHSVLGAVGTVLHATHLDAVFDIMGRPAHIIPEILADEEHQSVWGNIAQALAGHSDKGWGQVLNKYNILTGNSVFDRVVHNGLAFIGDVATDPLTYATFGAAGVSREVLGETAGKVVAKAFLEGDEQGAKLLAEAGGRWGVSSDEAFGRIWTNILHGEPLEEGTDLQKELAKRLAQVDPDARAALGHIYMNEGMQQSLLNALQASDNAVRHATSEGAGALGKMSKDLADKLGVPQEAVKEQLDLIRKGGSGVEDVMTGKAIGSKAAYEQAKAASSLLSGGVKFRMSIPVFNVRYVSNAIPFTGALNFQVGRRFFAGLSGYERLAKMVASGDSGATVDHLLAFWNDGFKGLQAFSKDQGDQVAMRLANGSFLHGGSFLYPLSDAMGGFTAHFAPHAALLRGGGIGEYIAANAYRTANSKRQAIADAILTTVKKDGTKQVPEETERQYIQLFNIKEARKNPEQMAQMWDDVQGYLRLIPTQAAHDAGAGPYFDDRIAQVIRTGTRADGSLEEGAQGTVAMLREQQNQAIALEQRLRGYGDGVLDGVALHRQVVQQGGDALLQHGIWTPEYASTVDAAHAATREDLIPWSSGGHEEVAGVEWEADDPTVLDMESGRLGEDQYTDKGAAHTARGIHLSEHVDAVPDGTLTEPVDIGVQGRTLLPGSRMLDANTSTYEAIYTQLTGEPFKAGETVVDADLESAIRRVAQGEGYDAVRRADGTVDVINTDALSHGMGGSAEEDPLAALQAALADSVAVENSRAGQAAKAGILEKSPTLATAPEDVVKKNSELAQKVKEAERVRYDAETAAKAAAKEDPTSQAAQDAAAAYLKAQQDVEKARAAHAKFKAAQRTASEEKYGVQQRGGGIAGLMDSLNKATTEEDFVKQAKKLPPPEPGFTRLWRGGEPIGDTGGFGGWSSTQVEEAAHYAVRRGGYGEAPYTGRLYYADIPTGDYRDELANRMRKDLIESEETTTAEAQNMSNEELLRKVIGNNAPQVDTKGLNEDELWALAKELEDGDVALMSEIPMAHYQLGLFAEDMLKPVPLPSEGYRSRVDEILNGQAKKEAEIATAQSRSRFMARALNPVVRDLRQTGTASTSELDVYAAAEKEAKATIAAFKNGVGDTRVATEEGSQKVGPEVADIIRAAVDDDQATAEVTQEILRQQGHDAIITIDEKGVKHGTFFPQEKNGPVPVKYIRDDAPRIGDETLGRVVHELTPDVRGQIRGAVNDRGIGANEQLVGQLQRLVVGKSVTEAEKLARNFLAEKGIRIGPGVRVFETDPLKIASRLANRVGGQVTDKYLARAARRIDLFGLARGPFRGDAVGIEKFRYVVQNADSVVAAASRVRKSEERMARLQNKLPHVREAAAEASLQAERLRQQLVAGLDAIGVRDLRPVNLKGLATDRTGRVIGDINPDEVHWVKTSDLLDQAQTYFRHATDVPAEGYETSLQHEITTKGYPKPIELSVHPDGLLEVTDGNHALSAAHEMGEEYVPVRAVTGPPVDAPLQVKANHIPQPTDLPEALRGADAGNDAEVRAADELKTKADKKYQQVLSQYDDATRELEKMQTQLKTKAAQVRAAVVPAEGSENMAGFERLGIPGLNDLAMPSFMAQEFYKAARPFKNLDGFHQHYRQFMGWWKTWATYMFPGFHARNFMGAWFNNWLGGVTIDDYVFTSRIRRAAQEELHGGGKWLDKKVMELDSEHAYAMGLDRLMSKEALQQLTYNDLAQLTSDLGINSAHGRAFAEARVGTEHLEEALGKKTLFERIPLLGQPYVKAAKGAGTMTENLFRGAAWVRGMKNTGGDVWGARAFTMIRHGDYQDLTDWEYGWVRDLIPFYKWMRTNTPFQIHQLFESPGKLLAVRKAQTAAFGAAGLDWNKAQYQEPEWMRNDVQLPFLGKDGAFNAVMLDLPMNDLFKSGREYLSSFLPLVRPMLESYVLKQSVFTGKAIGAKAVPLSPFFDALAPVMEAVGLAKKDAAGNPTVSEGTANIMNAIPIFSRFSNWMYEDPSKVNLRANTIASSIFGLGLRQVDQQAMTSSELDFYYSQVEPAVQYLQSLGYPLPTTADLQHAVGTTDQVLAGLGIQPGGVPAQAQAASGY